MDSIGEVYLIRSPIHGGHLFSEYLERQGFDLGGRSNVTVGFPSERGVEVEGERRIYRAPSNFGEEGEEVALISDSYVVAFDSDKLIQGHLKYILEIGGIDIESTRVGDVFLRDGAEHDEAIIHYLSDRYFEILKSPSQWIERRGDRYRSLTPYKHIIFSKNRGIVGEVTSSMIYTFERGKDSLSELLQNIYVAAPTPGSELLRLPDQHRER